MSIYKKVLEKVCIIRCRDAGVHFGIVKEIVGRTVRLENSRRMDHYSIAENGDSLSAVATVGVINDGNLRMQAVLDEIVLLEACEVIPVSEEIKEHLYSMPTYSTR